MESVLRFSVLVLVGLCAASCEAKKPPASASEESNASDATDGTLSEHKWDTKLAEDVLTSVPETGSVPELPDHVAPDSSEETSDSPDVTETDAIGGGADASNEDCPVWVPVEEPDYGKPPQAPSSVTSCSAKEPCSEGEMCSIDFFLSETITKGACYRACFHPQSDFPSELGCDASQYCMLVRRCLSSFPDPDCNPETGRNMQSIGWCGPKSRTQGGLGGNWDYFGCPCKQPSLSEAEKAECEASSQQ